MYSNYNKRIIIILSFILISATIFVFISYNYFDITSDQIQQLSITDLKTNSEIETYSISNILSGSISAISSNLQILANAPAMLDQNISKIQPLLDIAQNTTGHLTDTYFLLDRDGKIITYSNVEQIPRYKGVDLSNRDYFRVPLISNSLYISTVIDSNDGIPRMFISLPVEVLESTSPLQKVQNVTDQIPSVVVTGIAASSLGEFLEKQIHPQFMGSLGFLDRDGTILYSQNESYIGKNYFENEFQSSLDGLLGENKDNFNGIINKSLQLPSGIDEFEFGNSTITIAYQAVNNLINNGNNNNTNNYGTSIGNFNINNRIGTLYTISPHSLAHDVLTLMNIQETVNLFIIIAIVIVSLFVAILVIRWNKSLQKLVDNKTEELKVAIQKLRDSNEKLNLTKISLEKSNNEIMTANSRLRKANEDLKLNDKMQNEFINIAAHELRTPIQAITGNLELIQMAFIPSILKIPYKNSIEVRNEFESVFKNKEKFYEFIDRLLSIYRNSERLEKLVYNILDVSRIEMKKLEIHKEYFNINEKIINIIKDIKTRSTLLVENELNQKPEIIFHYEQNPITVHADRIRIYQVISNLIINAIKFSNDQPVTISVSITQSNESQNENKEIFPVTIEQSQKKILKEAIVSVQDKGTGIDDRILPRLFTKFATDSFSGTGLGLYISKNIIQAHGGRIWVKKNDNEKGTTFSFSLPLLD